MIVVSLLSFCTYGQLALQGFETPWTGSPAAPPGGWVVYSEIGTTTWVRTVTTNTQTPPHTGSYAAYLDRENVVPSAPIPTNWLITPQFNSPNNGQLHFYSRLTQLGDQGGTYKIMIAPVADPATPVTQLPFVDLVAPMGELTINPTQQEYVEKTFNIPAAYANMQVRIAFIMIGDQADRWLVDDVEVISQCTAPSTLTATDITLTSAKLSWNNPAGVTSWEIEVVPDASNPTGVGVTYSGQLPYQVNNLTADTAYKYYVRSLCTDGGKSAWVGPYFFTTPALGETCAAPLVIPTTQPLPYTTTNTTANFADNYEGAPGTGCGTTASYLSGNDVVYSYTPTITGSIQISLSGTQGVAGVFVYASCTNIGTNCIAGALATATAPAVIASMAVTAGTTYYIVVSSTTQTVPYTLTLQQVYCAAPATLAAANQTATSADISWAAGTATAWQIAVQPANSGLPTGAGQNVTQNTVTVSNTTTPAAAFTPATAYEFYVRANCGDGTYSIWSGPFFFSTTQIAVNLNYLETFDGPQAHGWSINNGSQQNKWYVGAATSNSPTNSLYVSNDGGVSNNYTVTTGSVVHAYRDIIIAPGTGSISVSFDLKAGGESTIDYVRAWLVPTTFVPTPGTQITTANGVQVGGNFNLTPAWTTQNVVVPTTTLAGSTRRLVFEWRNDTFGGAQPAGAIDNVNVKVITCPSPAAPTLTSATQTSATFSWVAPTGVTPANGYDYYYSQTNVTPSTTATVNGTTTATTQTITPLTSSETYYFWVRSNCGANDKSFWVGPAIVVVPQVPTTLPFIQNFDGTGSHGLSLSNGAQPNKWFVGTATFNSPGKSLYVSNDNGVTNSYNVSASSVVHAYRDITIPSDAGEISVNFDFKTVGELGWDYVRVWMVPTTFAPTTGTQITAGTAADMRVQLGGNLETPANWTTLSFDTPVNAYQGQNRRLVFEWRNDAVLGANPPAAIDNINVSVVTCPKPAGLAAINVTNTSATLDWVEPGSATNWEVVVMPATGAATPTGAGTPVTDSQYTPPAGSLVYGTQYVFYVRSMCGGTAGASKWSGPFAFALKPLNDECAQATVIPTNPALTCTNFGTGSIGGATASPQATTCFGTPDDDIWFQFVATNTSHIITLSNFTGNNTFLYHAVYSGTDCAALTQLYCGTANTSVANNLVVGQTYKVRVYTWTNTPNQTSNFQICVTTPPPPPANDPCSGAFALTVNPTLVCDQTTAGTIYSATQSPEATTCGGTKDDDVWFTFVATNTTHRISLLNITGSTTDLFHVLYSGNNCGALTQLYCSDPNESWANNLVVGQTYYLRVYSWTATAGQTSAFQVCVGTPPPPPANDECAGAVTVPVNPTLTCAQSVPGTITSATASPEANTCGNTADDDDIWFEFTATSTAQIIELKNITGSTTDLYHAVYVGDVCGTLTQLYCSDPNYSLGQNFVVGQTYKVRVWSNTTTANQTTAFDICVTTPPPPATNNECAGAINVPVNQDPSCTLFASGSVYGATASLPAPTCGATGADDDVWFEFTATATTHLISLNNIAGSSTGLYHALYTGDCGSLTQVACTTAASSVANNLVIGTNYKLRVYTSTTTPNQTTSFDVCVRIPNTPINVDVTTYTTEQLVTEVLFNTPCASITNITSSSQANFGGVPSLGYFDYAGGANGFPFSYGVILATNDAVVAEGPYIGNTAGSNTTPAWPGDADLEDIIVANDPAQISDTFNATKLEFDFVPLINKFEFDFLFASAEYGTFQCNYSDAFAFILTAPDGTTENLAVLPNTTIPVSVTNIRNSLYNTGCASANVQYFGQYNAGDPMASAINFNGQTKALTASAIVIPGQTYHIKLVIADYQDSSFNSAVFLGGGSFNIGSLDLGLDLLVDNGTAICDTESKVIDTQLTGGDYVFTWYKDGVLIPDATGSTYEATETGNYGVEASFPNIDCSFEGSIRVEFYPLVNSLTGDPVDMIVCDASGFSTFDITPNVDIINAGTTTPSDFVSTVHPSQADAEAGTNAIDPADYAAFTNTVAGTQTLWIRTVYTPTSCVGIKSFDLIVEDRTPQFTIDADFSICFGTSDTIDVVITDTDATPVTYIWTKDGVVLTTETSSSLTVTEAGEYVVTLDRTGCSTTATVNVTVTPIPVADAPADVTECGSYTLPTLSANNIYADANDVEIPAGTAIEEVGITTIRVIASSGTTPNCTAENTFTVTIIDAPTVVTPGDQIVCDSYVLPTLTTGNYFTAAGGTGTALSAGDVISTTQTIFVYAESVSGTVTCSSELSFVVTVNPTPVAVTPGTIEACDSYVLPALAAGSGYYTGQGGTGTQLSEGDVITTSQQIFVFAQTNTTPNCTDEEAFTVTITPTPAFTLGGPYVTCSAANVTISVAGANFDTAAATYAWTLDGAPVAGDDSITGTGFGTYTLTVTVNNCTHTESVEITQDPNAIALLFTEGCEDNTYMLNVIDDNGSFNIDSATYAWTGPNGFTATTRSIAAPVAGEYAVTVTTPDGCIGEDSFTVTDTSCDIQRGISPNGDGKNDSFELTTLNVKKLSIFNRYGQEVYTKNNYKNEWFGQTDKGDELPTGTYFYMIERNSGESHTGWIYINRQE